MRKKIYKPVMAVIPTLLLLLFLLPACSDESGTGTPDIPETKYAKLTITLGSLDSAEPSYTKAVGDDGYAPNDILKDSADMAFEHRIDDWYIIVVKGGTVDRVVSNNRNIQNIEYSDTNANNNNDDSETDISMDLIVGETYNFYALANLRGLENATTVIEGLGSLKGTSFNNFRTTAATLKTLTDYHGGEGTAYIPMSSYVGTQTVSENIEANKVKLQLIRLLGKVSVEVTNATGVDISVEKLTMGKFRTSGNIFLLPYDAHEKDPEKPNLLVNATQREDKLLNPSFPDTDTEEQEGEDYQLEPTENKTLAATGDNSKQTYSFYANETGQQNQPSGTSDMTIALEMEGVDRDSEPKRTNFFFIRRNDLLKIPILVSNAETTVSFEQKHMPIGGLPAAYKFNPGADVSVRTFVTDHAGDITITYQLNELSGSTTGWTLKYYKSTVSEKDHFCYAVLDKNEEDYLLIPAQTDDVSEWWDQSGYKNQPQPEWVYVLDHSNSATPNTGSFTVTAQELASAASATIRLNLVAENQEGTEVILPYTLTIKNDKEGGN